MDREKKIAEIRETVTCFMGAGNDTEYDRALNTLKENAGEWIPFLLLELEWLEREYAEERAAHNAHVAELLEKEAEVEKIQELAVKITKEREKESAKLNQAVEALEKIKKYYGEEGYYGYSVANQAIKSIKGGESDE